MSTVVYVQGKYNILSVLPREISSIDDLPPECRSGDGSTLCGSFLTSTGGCRIRRDRGCLLRRDPRFSLVDPGREAFA